MNIKKLIKRASQTQEGWLKPKLYRGHDEQEEREHVLVSLKASFEEEIARHEQAKAKADDNGQFGQYRYLSGVIDGLKDACAIISDKLADEWGM